MRRKDRDLFAQLNAEVERVGTMLAHVIKQLEALNLNIQIFARP